MSWASYLQRKSLDFLTPISVLPFFRIGSCCIVILRFLKCSCTCGPLTPTGLALHLHHDFLPQSHLPNLLFWVPQNDP